jgi:hypothetical protein
VNTKNDTLWRVLSSVTTERWFNCPSHGVVHVVGAFGESARPLCGNVHASVGQVTKEPRRLGDLCRRCRSIAHRLGALVPDGP